MIGVESIALAPGEHLGNAVFARKMIGHFQAIELQELADYAAADQGLDADFAHVEVAAGCTSPTGPRNAASSSRSR